MKISITINGKTLIATLEQTAAARAFAALLPMTLNLEDYNGTEKISTLAKRLDTKGAPEGYTPKTGDLAYYAPWGNMCIFYRGFRYSPSLIRLGTIEGDLTLLQQPGDVSNVTFKLIEPGS